MIACNRACLLALVLGIGVGTGRAQESVSQGSISGRVTDPQDIAPVLREAFASGRPNLVDMRVADGFGG